EVAAKSLCLPEVSRRCRALAVGDAQSLSLRRLLFSARIRPILNPAQARYEPGVIDVLHVPSADFSRIRPGVPGPVGGENSFRAAVKAVELAAAGLAQGVVHAPISKLAWNMAGVRFPGHTELLQKLCSVPSVAMAIAAGPLRTVLVTRHIPFSRVAAELDPGEIAETIRHAWNWMKALGLRRPRIGLCALNPHGGEKGLIGTEEIRILVPAVRRAEKALKAKISGPWPADSAFRAHRDGEVDCLVTLYHDQSLIPLKLVGAEKLVNITLGLPFPRTSPGHGTAFDIAGKNRADPGPMTEAILTAARMCGR
ncbi:MAG: hypothetical protein A2636_00505, partial [Elusimicrobia bacterium RIFCSPHIGHO2_01_FULL_64_10]